MLENAPSVVSRAAAVALSDDATMSPCHHHAALWANFLKTTVPAHKTVQDRTLHSMLYCTGCWVGLCWCHLTMDTSSKQQHITAQTERCHTCTAQYRQHDTQFHGQHQSIWIGFLDTLNIVCHVYHCQCHYNYVWGVWWCWVVRGAGQTADCWPVRATSWAGPGLGRQHGQQAAQHTCYHHPHSPVHTVVIMHCN